MPTCRLDGFDILHTCLHVPLGQIRSCFFVHVGHVCLFGNHLGLCRVRLAAVGFELKSQVSCLLLLPPIWCPLVHQLVTVGAHFGSTLRLNFVYVSRRAPTATCSVPNVSSVVTSALPGGLALWQWFPPELLSNSFVSTLFLLLCMIMTIKWSICMESNEGETAALLT